MKFKMLLIVLLIISGNIYSLESTEREIDNVTLNILYNINVFENIKNPGKSVLTSLLTSSISAGIGYHLNIIPYVLSPGIYIEGGLSVINIIYILSKMSDNDTEKNYNHEISKDEYSKKDDGIYAYGFLGIRLYNQFGFRLIDIQPFIGFSAFLFTIDSVTTGIGCLNFGILFAYKMFCIEYGYHIPYNNLKPIHRIGIGLHFK
jgi:hypothetical protein